MVKCKREGCPLCAAQMQQPMLQPPLNKSHSNDWCVPGTPRQLGDKVPGSVASYGYMCSGTKDRLCRAQHTQGRGSGKPPSAQPDASRVVFLQSTHPTRPPLSTCAPSSVSSAHEAWVPFPSQIRVQSPNPVMGNSTHSG